MIEDHGIHIHLGSTKKCRLTVFVLHTVLLTIFLSVLLFLDMTKSESANNTFLGSAQENRFIFYASSEWLGTNIGHSRLNYTKYDWRTKF
jgi:hypothetical protein